MILKKYQPEIVCLQEVITNNKDYLTEIEKLDYQLADYTNCFFEYGKIWGIATLYKKKSLQFNDSKTIPLVNSFYEIVRQIANFFQQKEIKRTVLKTTFQLINSSKKITIYNIHLSAISFNNLRIKQLQKIMFNEIDKKGVIILCGDFNFPIQRKKLETIMKQYQLKEATNKIYYTINYFNTLKKSPFNFIIRFFLKIVAKIKSRAKLDYIFYRNLKHIKTQRLDYSFSDHYPLLAEFEIF